MDKRPGDKSPKRRKPAVPSKARAGGGGGGGGGRHGGGTRKAAPAGRRSRAATEPPWPQGVQPTHLDKVMFPQRQFTKGDVLRFYQRIAPRLLPHLRDRPMTVERLPDGLAGKATRFWQKNTPDYYPDWIPRVELPGDRGPVRYALVNDLATLLYFVNQGALTFHPWLSRVGSLDRPDFVLFDLDPGAARFADVVRAARTLHELLADERVASFPKTSGKSGLHVLVPWSGEGGYDEARGWAMARALRLVEALPDLATVERLKARRHGHVYVDVIQNAKGHHVVPPYVLRAVPAATVSTPLHWDELTGRLDPRRFDIVSVISRVSEEAADPMGALAGGAGVAAAPVRDPSPSREK